MALFDLLPFNLCLKDYEFSHVEGDLDKSSLKWLCLTRKVNVESKQAYCEAHKAKPQHLQTMNILIMKYETFARSQKKSHKNEIIESIKSSNLGN